MAQAIFYHEILRKLVISFGTLFNEIYIIRRDSGGSTTSSFKVPIVYAPKQKYRLRVVENIGLDKQVGIVYPRMSYNISSISYDSSRKVPMTNRINCIPTDNLEGSQYLFAPTPYIVNIELYIIGRNQEDVFQIVEKILPYFSPVHTITADTIPGVDLHEDIPIALTSSPFEDPYDGDIAVDRDIVWTLQFAAKVNFYTGLQDKKIIRKIGIDFLVPEGDIDAASMAATPRSARITIEPDPDDASPEDDYGFSLDITEYEDGLKYNPVDGSDDPVPT